MTESIADVIVMDGFIGNITLKLIEGVSAGRCGESATPR